MQTAEEEQAGTHSWVPPPVELPEPAVEPVAELAVVPPVGPLITLLAQAPSASARQAIDSRGMAPDTTRCGLGVLPRDLLKTLP
jgi:hypothetical protein